MPSPTAFDLTVSERLSRPARVALDRAGEAARGRRRQLVTLCDLLTGLLHAEPCITAEILNAAGVDLPRLRRALVAEDAPAARRRGKGPLSFSPHVVRLLETAHDDARARGDALILPVHLVRALLAAHPAAPAPSPSSHAGASTETASGSGSNRTDGPSGDTALPAAPPVPPARRAVKNRYRTVDLG